MSDRSQPDADPDDTDHTADRVLQLRGLIGTLAGPDPLSHLRRLTARRHRRRGVLAATALLGTAVLAAVLVVDVELLGGDDAGTDEQVHTVDQPPDPTRPPPDPTPTPSTDPAPHAAGATGLPLDMEWIQASPEGVVAITHGGTAVGLSDQPTGVAYALDGYYVVAQDLEPGSGVPWTTSGAIVVLDPTGSRQLTPGHDDPAGFAPETFSLHDVGIVEGRAVAVVSHRVNGAGPDTTDERLLLIDLADGSRTDLGSVGGWESGVFAARLVGDRIITLVSAGASSFVVARAPDGTVAWDHPEGVTRAEDLSGHADVVHDSQLGLAVGGGRILLLQPGFSPDGRPDLIVTELAPATGAAEEPRAIPLDPVDGTGLPSGICFLAELSGEELLCDNSTAGSIRIDLATGRTTTLASTPASTATLPRSLAGADIVDFEQPVETWSGRLITLTDGHLLAPGFGRWLGTDDVTDPEAAARTLLGLAQSDDHEVQVDTGPGRATVTLTQDITGDDSSSGVRHVVTLEVRDGRVTGLIGATWATRCARGLDTTSFTPQLCP